MRMSDVRVGMKLRSKSESVPRIVEVVELTARGFRYRCEKHSVKLGEYKYGTVEGGEHFGHGGECLYEPLKEEYDSGAEGIE